MSQYLLSDTARTDLAEIWFYIAQDNPDAADKFMRALVSRFPLLAAMPEMGRQREELAPRLRSFPSATTSSFTARWKKVFKSHACCTQSLIR
jgi:toxin ParE1/3/4